MKIDFDKRIFVGLTAREGKGWEKKLKEINKYKIKRIALFTEEVPKEQRIKIYQELSRSCVTEIPLVHIRNDTSRKELIYLRDKFKTKIFTIHENGFPRLKHWEGFHKNLYLEMNFDNLVRKNVDVKKIGGFCIDLSHFKASEERWTKDFEYIVKQRKIKKYFRCNHLNGYSYKKSKDMHYIKYLSNFDYLKTLPKFVFGEVIALEMYNPIKQQIKYKKYLSKLLNEYFSN
jgi:hypothetical protein